MINILYLYPHLMNLYGDYANITVLKKHLEDQGLKVRVDKKDVGDIINFSNYDFIYMGSGTESNQLVALNDLLKYKDSLNDCINSNKVILFTGNAMELLGKSIDDKEALGIFDFSTKIIDKRLTGDVIVKSRELGPIVGFINKSSLIEGGETEKLFNYIFMDSNLQDNAYEGYTRNNTFGTHVIGPVLVKNPRFMEKIVQLLLPEGVEYNKIDYKYEKSSYEITLKALKERSK